MAQALSGVDTGAAMLAQSFFARELLQVGYDIMLRPIGRGGGALGAYAPPI